MSAIQTSSNGAEDITSGLSDITMTSSSVIELNVGGVLYATTLSTLQRDPNSLLGSLFSKPGSTACEKDGKGRFFIDRDGVLFRYVLDYVRNQKLILPDIFHEKERLKQEADYFRYARMACSQLLLQICPDFMLISR